MCGSLTESELQELKLEKPNIKYFIETGTYKADTSIAASKHYEKVFTTEIYEPLYLYSKERASKEATGDRITFLLGNSVDLLDKILSENSITSAVYFIDAHISGSDSSWNFKEMVPLLEELDVILKYRPADSILIFDDMRFWKNNKMEAQDWRHIDVSTILNKILSKGIGIEKFYEKNDRLFIVTC